MTVIFGLFVSQKQHNPLRSFKIILVLVNQGKCDVNMSPDPRLSVLGGQSIISADVRVYAFEVEDPFLRSDFM